MHVLNNLWAIYFLRYKNHDYIMSDSATPLLAFCPKETIGWVFKYYALYCLNEEKLEIIFNAPPWSLIS